MPLSELEGRLLQEGGPALVVERSGADRLALTLRAPIDHRMVWSPNGAALVVVGPGGIDLIDPTGARPARRITLPRPAPAPAPVWVLDDGRVVVDRGEHLDVWSGDEWTTAEPDSEPALLTTDGEVPADDGEQPPDADDDAIAASMDPTGRWRALRRAYEVEVRSLDGDEATTVRVPIATHDTEAIAVGSDESTWVFGLSAEQADRLPSVSRAGPLSWEPDVGGVGAYGGLRIGGRSDSEDAVAEALLRFTPYVLGTGGEGELPEWQHLLMPSVQLGVDFYMNHESTEAGFRLNNPHTPSFRVSLPVVYRARKLTRYGGERYGDGAPVSISLEPGYHTGRDELELGLSVTSEVYGGVYGRVAVSRDGDPRIEGGVELGWGTTGGLALAAVGAFLVLGLGTALEGLPIGCCTGPQPEEDGSF